ncbi:MAG: 4Fe-4S binding protein [Dehalococcoidia bacterium]|nr:4Fe-4S binding protein [Dehalococcoidia bacterium]
MEDSYHRLSEAYGFPESRYLPRILEKCLTEREASLLLSLPGTAEEVAGKLCMDVSSVQSILGELFQKGFIFYDLVEGKRRYTLITNLRDAITVNNRVEQFGEEFFDLWARMYDEEVSRDFDVEGYEARVIPVHEAIEPGAEILPYEKVSGLLEKAETIAVMRCPCRITNRRCDNPVETCITLNGAAKYVLERGVGRELTREEALSLFNQCEDAGLIHQVGNGSLGVSWICNCCACCCVYLRAQIISGKKYATVKTRYRAVVDSGLCNECGLCIDRCNFGTIKMVNSKPVIDEEKCFGCGLCASQCPVNAISLSQTKGPEYIPTREAEPLFSSI